MALLRSYQAAIRAHRSTHRGLATCADSRVKLVDEGVKGLFKGGRRQCSLMVTADYKWAIFTRPRLAGADGVQDRGKAEDRRNVLGDIRREESAALERDH